MCFSVNLLFQKYQCVLYYLFFDGDSLTCCLKKNHSPDFKERRKRLKHVNTATDKDVLSMQDNVSSVMVIYIYCVK